MKHTSIRKPLSVLLSILMALSVFSVTAFAGPPSGNDAGSLVTETDVTVGGPTEKTIAEGVIYKQGDTIVLPGDGIYYVKDSERHPAQEIYSNGTVQLEYNEPAYTLMIEEWGIYAHFVTFDYEEEMSQGLSVLGIKFTGSGTESDPYLPKLAFGVIESTWAGEGEGTEASPWLIKDLNDLRTLSANVASGMTYSGKYLKLAADIDCGSDNWEAIGGKNKFMGTFDGDSHTITYNVATTEDEDEKDKGLFYEIGAGGTVKNLNVAGSISCASLYSDRLGGIAVYNAGTITNCASYVAVTGYGCFVAGIAALCQDGATISYCAASGTVSWPQTGDFYSYVAGITGQNDTTTISNCTALCDIIAPNADAESYAGRLVARDFGGAYSDNYYLSTAQIEGEVNSDYATAKTADELKEIGQAAYDAGYTVYGLALGAVASNPDQEAVETLELTQHDSGFNGNCFSVTPGSMTDLYDYTNSWDFDGDDSLSEMGVTISALYGEDIRKVVVYARSHWNSFWNGTPVAVAGDTTLTYTRDGNTFTFDNVEASSVIIGASSGTGLMISKIDVYYADTDHDVVKTVRLIDAIGTVAYTTACKQKIDAAKAAYEALTDEQKALVSNYETLQLAEGQYAALQLAADMTAFEAYKTAKKSAMDALLQEGDSEAVQSIVGLAKTQITGFTYDESKTLDENKAALDTLVANVPNAVAEQRAADAALAEAKEAAKAELANYKNAADYRPEQQTELENAIADGNTAIDAAADADAVATALADAKAAIDLIKTDAQLTAEEKAAADQAAADEVAALIDAIGEVSYNDESKGKIDAARAAYDALTDDQKALVENVDVLTAAEAKYDELKAAAETPDDPADEPSDPTGGTPCVYCGEYHDGGLLDKLIIVIHGFLAYFRAFFALFGVNQ